MTARPPANCPVCSERLQVSQLGCPSCGTGLTGAFESCEFCSLDTSQRDVLRVFLASRGNVRELERHLGVSYPTARSRVDDLLRALGLAATEPENPAQPEPSGLGADQRLATLRAVAAGQLGVDEARAQLGGP